MGKPEQRDDGWYLDGRKLTDGTAVVIQIDGRWVPDVITLRDDGRAYVGGRTNIGDAPEHTPTMVSLSNYAGEMRWPDAG